MISHRLESLVKYVEKHDQIIDIGCDHALLDIYLVKNGYANKMIVSDIHQKALESGINNIKKENLLILIDTRLGNGLDVLNDNDNIDTILISGMGSKTIIEILNSKYLININKLIIQSNRDYDILREEIIKLGFYIETEEVIEDNNKIYINMVFLRGKKEYSENDLKYGTKNMINKKVYYDYLIKKKEKIIKQLSNEDLINELNKEILIIKQL